MEGLDLVQIKMSTIDSEMRIINFPLREYAEYSLSLIHFIHGNPYKDDAKTRKCFEIQCWFL